MQFFANKFFHRSRRILSFLTVVVFCLSDSAMASTTALSIQPKSAELSEVLKLTPELVPSFEIPSTIGSIDEFFKGHSDKVVFLIQDAHAQYAAQKSIQDLIVFLSKYDISTTLLEGGVGKMDNTILKVFPDQEKIKLQLENLMQKGELSWAVSASILVSDSTNFYGLEDLDLYEKQIKSYLNAYLQNQAVNNELQLTRQRIEKEKIKYYSKELLALENKQKAYQTQEISIHDWLRYLEKIKTPELFPLIRIVSGELQRAALESNQSWKSSLERLSKLMDSQPTMNADSLKKLNAKKQEFETGRVDQVEYLNFLLDLSG